MEDYYAQMTPIVDKTAQNLYQSNPGQAINFITDYSVNTANALVERWQKLFEFLLVKYIDGNIKQEVNGVFQWNEYHGAPAAVGNPQYPDWWKKEVIDATGDKLLVP